MEYTEQQRREFIQEFGRRRKRQLTVTLPVMVVVVLASLDLEGEAHYFHFLSLEMLTGLTILLVLGILLFSLKNWRCPACNKYLGKGWNPRYCPHCGIQLTGEFQPR